MESCKYQVDRQFNPADGRALSAHRGVCYCYGIHEAWHTVAAAEDSDGRQLEVTYCDRCKTIKRVDKL